MDDKKKYVFDIKTKDLNFKSLANLAILLNKIDVDNRPIALDLKEVENNW